MPPHLWELAQRDVRSTIPERLRGAADGVSSAPAAVRTVAKRIAALAAVGGAAATIRSFADDPAVALADTSVPLGPGVAPPGAGLDPAPTVPGGGHGTPFGHVGSHTEGGTPADAGLGSTWHVSVDDGSGHASVLTVQLFQDVAVVENADGTFTVVADQVIRVVDPDGHEHVFHDHYQVVVPDPPGQETDLVVHEDGHVRLVENADGSFTPIVDHDIAITSGADGDGHDEVSIDQDERVSVNDHDPHHGDTVRVDLSETAGSSSQDVGDEATTTIDQDERLDDGSARRAPETSGGSTPAGVASSASSAGASSAAAPVAASSAATTAAVGTVAADAVVPVGPGAVPDGWRLDDAVAPRATEIPDPSPLHDTGLHDTGPHDAVAPPDAVFTGGHDAAPDPAPGPATDPATTPSSTGGVPPVGPATRGTDPSEDGPDHPDPHLDPLGHDPADVPRAEPEHGTDRPTEHPHPDHPHDALDHAGLG